MFGLLRVIAMIVGAISLTLLLWRNGGIEIGGMVSGILDVYESQLQQLFHLAQPIVDSLLGFLRSTLGLEFELHRHWKHVFILLWLIQGSAVLASWRLRTMVVQGRTVDLHGLPKVDAAVGLSVGLALTFVTAVVSGLVPIQNASVTDSMAFGAIVILGLQLTFFLVYLVSLAVGTVIGVILSFSSSGRETIAELSEVPSARSKVSSIFVQHIIAGMILLLLYGGFVYALPTYLPSSLQSSVSLYSLIGVILSMTTFLLVLGLIDAVTLVSEDRGYFEALMSDSYFIRGLDITMTVATAAAVVLLGMTLA